MSYLKKFETFINTEREDMLVKNLETSTRESIVPVNNDIYNLKIGSIIIYQGNRYTVSKVDDFSFKIKSSKGNEYNLNYGQFEDDGARIVS